MRQERVHDLPIGLYAKSAHARPRTPSVFLPPCRNHNIMSPCDTSQWRYILTLIHFSMRRAAENPKAYFALLILSRSPVQVGGAILIWAVSSLIRTTTCVSKASP